MMSSEVLKKHYSKLVKTLPMNDAIFVAELYSCDLLPGDLRDQLNLPHRTSADKATLFLNNVIEPSVTSGVGSSFEKLLTIMEDCDHESVKELAKLIKTSLRSSNSDDGIHSTTSEPASKNVKSSPLDVSRLKAQYIDLLPTGKTDWPKHKLNHYVRLAIIEKEDITLRDKNFDEFTRLTLQGDVDKILKKKKPLSDLRDIFHYENEPCPRLILIMGGPGIGKTTMAHELCSRWAKDGFLAEDFDVVILIPLRSLQHRSLKDMIETQIGEENYRLLEKSAGRRCLIILEGLDEVSSDHRQNDPFLRSLVTECNKLQEARVIITSRPHACEDIDANRRIEVVGFGKDEISEFVKHSFPNDIQSSVDFLRQLGDHPQLHSLCYIPLNLVIVLDVFNCNEKKLPSTLTELYQVFIVMTMKRQVKKKNMKNKPVSPVEAVTMAAEHVKEMLRGIPKETIGIVLCLCRLAYQGFFDWYCDMKSEHSWQRQWKDPKIIFTESELAQCDIEVASNFDGFSLLKVTEVHQVSMDINTYNFNHLTIQEFLCAVYITSLSQQEQLRLLREYFDDYPNVFIFVCGLTGLASSEMVQFIHHKLQSYGRDVITAIRCINESKQSSTAHQLVSPVAINVSYSLLPYDLLCLSNILSSYPVTQLNMGGCSIGNKGSEMFMKHHTNRTTTCQLLEKLDLSYNELTSEGMEHMVKVVKTNSSILRVLDVSYNDIGDDGMAVISEALQENKSLTTLNVYMCGLSVKGAKYVSQLLNVTHTLQVLSIGSNDIDDDGIAVISEALQHNKSLTILRVQECGLSAKGAITISNIMMANHSLQLLNMSRNSIGNDGISAIARELGNCKINVLDVGQCGVTLTGARSLATALSSHPNIRKLWLWDNPITVEGAQLIVEAAVHNTVCLDVYIDDEYENDTVKEMLTILENRSRQEWLLQQQEDSTEINSNNSSDEKPIVPLPIIAGGGQTVHMSMESLLMTATEDDNHSGRGWEEQ